MIKCNLSILLAERNLKISELSKRTGISRTTLTSLAQNQSKGIQFDTFDTICSFLKVSPNDLFTQEKFEYDFSVLEKHEISYKDRYELTLNTEIVHHSNKFETTIKCNVEIFENDSSPTNTIAVKITYPFELFDIFTSIPVIFKTYFESELLECIKAEIVVTCDLDEDTEIHSY